MQNQKRTALLVGATGLVGGHCLHFLLNDAHYHSVITLTRKEIPVKHSGLQQHIVNFDNLESFSPLVKADDIFCCLGTTIRKAGSQANFKKVDLEYPVNIARIAVTNGAKQFLLVTAMGADKSSLIFYNRVKGQAEEAVKDLAYQAIHIFRPSLLLGERKEIRVGEKIGAAFFNVTAPFFIGPLRKYRAIEAKAVAGAMAACAIRNGNGIFIYESDEIQKIFNQNCS